MNSIKVETKGRSININKEDQHKIDNILIWHFIWSKFYYYTKKYGKFISLLIFIPLLIRIIIKILFYKILKKKNLANKYIYRLNGLIRSMASKSSDLRP
tara:strand:- start:207 stop:503 length:297 start_codon:yes stop_codon:yes gene_type:complete